jgi:hypothetical protein
MQIALQQQGLDTPSMRRLAGELALRSGQPLQALEHLLPLLESLPDDRQVLQLLLMSWQRLGREDEPAHAWMPPWSSTRSCTTCGWHAWRWKRSAAHRRRHGRALDGRDAGPSAGAGSAPAPA